MVATYYSFIPCANNNSRHLAFVNLKKFFFFKTNLARLTSTKMKELHVFMVAMFALILVKRDSITSVLPPVVQIQSFYHVRVAL